MSEPQDNRPPCMFCSHLLPTDPATCPNYTSSHGCLGYRRHTLELQDRVNEMREERIAGVSHAMINKAFTRDDHDLLLQLRDRLRAAIDPGNPMESIYAKGFARDLLDFFPDDLLDEHDVQRSTPLAWAKPSSDLAEIAARWSSDGGMGNTRGAEDYTDAGCRVFAEHGFRDVPALLARVKLAEDAVARVRALHATSWCCFGTPCPTIQQITLDLA